MRVKDLLWQAASAGHRAALPILSFPAAQKLGVSVEELVKSAELQAAAMACIAAETDAVAAVSLMDLSVEAEAFGAAVRFFPDEVPAVVGQLVSDEDEAEALEVPPLTAGRLSVCVAGVRLARERIADKPVLAGCIGPYSLAGRLCDVTEIMYLCFDEPDMVHTVLEKATELLIAYGQAMKDAGADGLMMAEPLAGLLSPDMAREFSHGYVKQIVEALQDADFSVIYHNCGNSVACMLDDIFAIGADGCHFGNAVDMEAVMKAAPADVLCMGNIDPAGQFVQGTPETMRAAVKTLLDRCGKYPNFVLSSGCDIPAHAAWENIHGFFEAVKQWS
ncbi:MAG: uroporphyrinogen decarboxylase family protein [Oscillospiraceae bacterium]|nr:uroporphyrinogen decarboxylase family protein [Oscillospiraceae bacterium]